MGTPTDALVEYLRDDDAFLTKADIKYKNVIGRRVHSDIVDIDIRSIVISSMGIGDGGGHKEQTPYETREIECRAYDKFMGTAEDLSDIATYSILSARRKCYEGSIFRVYHSNWWAKSVSLWGHGMAVLSNYFSGAILPR